MNNVKMFQSEGKKSDFIVCRKIPWKRQGGN